MRGMLSFACWMASPDTACNPGRASSDSEARVTAATKGAEDTVDELEAISSRQGQELSLLRAEKQQLQRKVHVATQERSQLQHAARALCHDNVAMLKAASALESKIEKVNSERLVFIAECDKHRKAAAHCELELEKLQVSLQGAKMLGLSSVLAAGHPDE
jgi:chromosome segregation ATPase